MPDTAVSSRSSVDLIDAIDEAIGRLTSAIKLLECLDGYRPPEGDDSFDVTIAQEQLAQARTVLLKARALDEQGWTR